MGHHSGKVKVFKPADDGTLVRDKTAEEALATAIRAKQRPSTEGQRKFLSILTGTPVEDLVDLTHRQAAIRIGKITGMPAPYRRGVTYRPYRQVFT